MISNAKSKINKHLERELRLALYENSLEIITNTNEQTENLH